MTNLCLPQTLLPGASRLYIDYLYDFSRTSQFYTHNPWRAGTLARVAREVRYPPERRAALVDALRRRNGDNPALQALARPDTVVVVTGQQTGLFGGPLYTLYKALTAAKLASELKAAGIPAVAVFWMATQDHDYEEVRHVWLYDEKRVPLRLSLPETGSVPMAVGVRRLDKPPLERLGEIILPFPHGQEVFAWIKESYAEGESMGNAFHGLLSRMLAGYDILFVDPMEAELRALCAGILGEAVDRFEELDRAVRERNQALELAGYHAQVRYEPGASFFFLLDENGRRLPVRRLGREFYYDHQCLSANELRRRSAYLSPNALLRPVVQDYLLPTAAAVLGPAELAYQAQVQPLYEMLLGRVPLLQPRAGFTILDARARKLLHRYQLDLAACFTDFDTLRLRLAAALVPGEIRSLFAALRSKMDRSVTQWKQHLTDFDPSLSKAAETSARKILYQIEKIERKTAREAFRKETLAAVHAAYLFNTIYPGRRPQERFYSALSFLAQHGSRMVGAAYDRIDTQCPDHKVLEL